MTRQLSARVASGAMKAMLRPADALRQRAGIMYPNRALSTKSVVGVGNDIVMVDALSTAIFDAINALRTPEGRIDEREIGAFVLRRMIEQGGALRFMPAILGVTDPQMQERIIEQLSPMFGEIITRAVDRVQDKSGLTNIKDVAEAVAVHVFNQMKEKKR